jgi:hypothetical protein
MCDTTSSKKKKGKSSKKVTDNKHYSEELYQHYVKETKDKVSIEGTDLYYSLKDAVVSIMATSVNRVVTYEFKDNTQPLDPSNVLFDGFVPGTIIDIPVTAYSVASTVKTTVEEHEPIGLTPGVLNIIIRTTDTTVTEYSTGFFDESGHIITGAHGLLQNDDGNGIYNRIPAPPDGHEQHHRHTKYHVRVNNVNQSGKSYIYEASLIGLSGSLDVGVLKIENKKTKDGPPDICNQAGLVWGKSRTYANGQPIYMISESVWNGAGRITKGTITDNLYSDNINYDDGFNQNGFHSVAWAECISLDLLSTSSNSGSPILDRYGRVIGILMGRAIDPNMNHPSVSFAVSENIARRVTTALIEGPRSKCYGGHIEDVRDAAGHYYRYAYGDTGITEYEIFSSRFFNIIPNLRFFEQKGYIINKIGEDIGGMGPQSNMITNTLAIQRAFPNIFDISNGPVRHDNELYLITEINDQPLGTTEQQIPFSSVLHQYVAGDCVKLTYRLGSEGFYNSYDTSLTLIYRYYPNDQPQYLNMNLLSNGEKEEVEETPVINPPSGSRSIVAGFSYFNDKIEDVIDEIDSAIQKVEEDNDLEEEASGSASGSGKKRKGTFSKLFGRKKKEAESELLEEVGVDTIQLSKSNSKKELSEDKKKGWFAKKREIEGEEESKEETVEESKEDTKKNFKKSESKKDLTEDKKKKGWFAKKNVETEETTEDNLPETMYDVPKEIESDTKKKSDKKEALENDVAESGENSETSKKEKKKWFGKKSDKAVEEINSEAESPVL